MEIVLRNNMIIVKTGFDTLKASWMEAYFQAHSQDMLFLPKSVLVFANSALQKVKEDFIYDLCSFYTRNEEEDNGFYLRSVLKYIKFPIKIELQDEEKVLKTEVRLEARSSSLVHLRLDNPNPWLMSYLRSQLEIYITHEGKMNLFLELPDNKSKARFERVLNKRNILNYEISYIYDAYFMRNLYSDYAGFEFESHDNEEEHEMLHYYTVLECPVGSSQDALKRSYKKLVKVYHPDKVHYEGSKTINHYTQKFQLLQEAYAALKIVS